MLLKILALDLGFKNIGWATNEPFEYGYFHNNGENPYKNYYLFLQNLHNTYNFNFVAIEQFRHYKTVKYAHLTSEIAGITKLFCQLHNIPFIEVNPSAHKKKKIDFSHRNSHVKDAISILYYTLDILVKGV